MTQTTANGVQVEYDTFGNPADPTILLVMGLGAQMISWHPDFCGEFVARSFHVVRYDNRDVGLSQKFEAAGVPNMAAIMEARAKGEKVEGPYTLADMADDGIGLLDAIGIARAHIIGASMGGMIVQEVALRHPDRALTMTSIMSTTGNPELPGPTPEAQARLVGPAPTDREAYIEYTLQGAYVIGSPDVVDEEAVRERAGQAFDRAFYPQGTARQLAGVTASEPRHERLRSLRVPTLVIHGEIDPLVPVEGGRDTAAAIPGAELLVIERMGHDLPRAYWPRIVDAIVAHTAKAGAAV